MKSIWYFVGLLLVAMGSVIFASGLYGLWNPPAEQKVLAHLHPDLWWGIFMLVFGVVFTLLNRGKIAE